MIKAWDIALQTMKRGAKAQILSKLKFAYGLKGYKEKVPSATSVLFIIELIDFHGQLFLFLSDQKSFSFQLFKKRSQ